MSLTRPEVGGVWAGSPKEKGTPNKDQEDEGDTARQGSDRKAFQLEEQHTQAPEAEMSVMDRLISGWRDLGAQERQCQWCGARAVFRRQWGLTEGE